MAKYFYILISFVFCLNCNSQIIRKEKESLIPERKRLVVIRSKFQNDTLYYFEICYRGIVHDRIIDHRRFYWLINMKNAILPNRDCLAGNYYDKDELRHDLDTESFSSIRNDAFQSFYDEIIEIEAAFNLKNRNGQEVKVYKDTIIGDLTMVILDRFYLYKHYLLKRCNWGDTDRMWYKYKEKDVLLIRKRLVDYIKSHNISIKF